MRVVYLRSEALANEGEVGRLIKELNDARQELRDVKAVMHSIPMGLEKREKDLQVLKEQIENEPFEASFSFTLYADSEKQALEDQRVEMAKLEALKQFEAKKTRLKKQYEDMIEEFETWKSVNIPKQKEREMKLEALVKKENELRSKIDGFVEIQVRGVLDKDE